MRHPLSLHVSRDGEDADLMDSDGNLIAEFVDANEGRELLALIEKGRSIGRQGANYDPPGDDVPNFTLNRGPSAFDRMVLDTPGCTALYKCDGLHPDPIRPDHEPEPIEAPLERRLAEFAETLKPQDTEALFLAGLASSWAEPPADAATDSPTD